MNQLDLMPREVTSPLPGTVHIPNWLTIPQQNALLNLIRVATDGRWYTPEMPNGTPMKHPIACLGYAWKPYLYFIQEPYRPLPQEVIDITRKALLDARISYHPYEPDTGIVNWFPPDSSLGWHQDKSEHPDLIAVGSPIVTFSIGDSAIFRLNDEKQVSGSHELELRSGDVLIMSGRSRLAWHEVNRILPDTRPIDLNLDKAGRVSLTIRQALVHTKR